MKALSQRQADRCENARTPHCRCRCGGAFHGTGRPAGTVPIADAHAPAFYSKAELKDAKRPMLAAT